VSQVNHTPYRDLHLLPIAGAWREGSAPQSLQVSDPYNGKPARSSRLPAMIWTKPIRPRSAPGRVGDDRTGAALAILHRAVQIFDERREEIIGWIIRESGSTRIKAQIEWGAARSITTGVSLFSGAGARAHSAVQRPGQGKSRLPRAAGVVGVISPWNFPLHPSVRWHRHWPWAMPW
jgi:aldehyde dehydrogenase (NAD+)